MTQKAVTSLETRTVLSQICSSFALVFSLNDKNRARLMLGKASSPFSISVPILKCSSVQNLIKVYHVVKEL